MKEQSVMLVIDIPDAGIRTHSSLREFFINVNFIFEIEPNY